MNSAGANWLWSTSLSRLVMPFLSWVKVVEQWFSSRYITGLKLSDSKLPLPNGEREGERGREGGRGRGGGGGVVHC